MDSVFVQVDKQGRIIAVNSSAFLSDTVGWIKVDEGSGDRYHHAQALYLGDIFSSDGFPLYSLVNGRIKARTAAELENDRLDETPVPTMEELKEENKILHAQLQAVTDRADFVDDCIAEMAGILYS